MAVEKVLQRGVALFFVKDERDAYQRAVAFGEAKNDRLLARTASLEDAFGAMDFYAENEGPVTYGDRWKLKFSGKSFTTAHEDFFSAIAPAMIQGGIEFVNIETGDLFRIFITKGKVYRLVAKQIEWEYAENPEEVTLVTHA